GPICTCSFLFQAEDGIRDFHVTGVQTCALPISFEFFRVRLEDCRLARFIDGDDVFPNQNRRRAEVPAETLLPLFLSGLGVPAERSEERRVGKEWGARGWEYA